MKNVDERFKNFKIEDFLFGNGNEIASRKKLKHTYLEMRFRFINYVGSNFLQTTHI